MGALLYLRQEGRGIGLHAKIQAYHLQDAGADTLDANLMLGHPADARDYAIAAEMLADIGVERVELMTNNPEKVAQLTKHGIDVASRSPLIVGVGSENRDYLATKGERMGHHITGDDLWRERTAYCFREQPRLHLSCFKWGRGRELNPGWQNHNLPC